MLTTDRLVDLRMKVCTSSIFRQKNPLAALHASPSQPVPFKQISLALGALRGGHPNHFVDIGCGVGRACFFAAYFGHFSNVTGIDFDAELIELAKKNDSKFDNVNSVAVDFQIGDAREYRLPDEECVVFLYNPFDGSVLYQFLENNRANFQKKGSVIVYVNDVHRNVLIEKGLVPTAPMQGMVTHWKWPP